MSNYKLTELFPHIDDEIIHYAYIESDGNLEKSINLLLQMIKDTKYDDENLSKINFEIQAIEKKFLNKTEETEEMEEKDNEKEVIKGIIEQNDRQIAQELHDEILCRTIQDILQVDYNNNQEQIQNKKKSKKNKENIMKKFSKKFKELFSKMSCSCYSDVNHRRGYSNIENNLLDEEPVREYNINSYIDEMPNSEENQNSPRSISPSEITLIENEPIEIQDISKQTSLSEINI